MKYKSQLRSSKRKFFPLLFVFNNKNQKNTIEIVAKEIYDYTVNGDIDAKQR